MFDYVTLIKVRGAEAGKTTEVTRQAYNKNKDGVFKDWQVKDEPKPQVQTPKPNPASEGAAGGESAENTTENETTDSEFDDYTVKQLKAYAEQEGIEYADPIKKAELLELIKAHTTKK